jgi:hypothetical protein
MKAMVNCNPTIVVKSVETGGEGRFALVEVLGGKLAIVKGAGFQPGEVVTITFCEEDKAIAKAEANKCGAFAVKATIPAVAPGVYSVKALNGDVCRAAWPIDIVK